MHAHYWRFPIMRIIVNNQSLPQDAQKSSAKSGGHY